jgi:hypothetical protein
VALINGSALGAESRAKSIGCVSLGAMSVTPVGFGTRTAAVIVVAGTVDEVSSKLRVDTSVGCRSKLFPLEIDVMLELELVLAGEEDEAEDGFDTDVDEEMGAEIDEEVEDEDDDEEELETILSLMQLPATSLMLEKVYDEPMV